MLNTDERKNMVLENKLNITDSTELARMEEKISKKKAVELFENGYLNKYKAGSFEILAAIHKYLFGEIYDFAGKVRNVNIAKGNFRLCIYRLQSRILRRCHNQHLMKLLKNMLR